MNGGASAPNRMAIQSESNSLRSQFQEPWNREIPKEKQLNQLHNLNRPRANVSPLNLIPQWLRGRRGVVVVALLVISVGMALNWTWLTAIGVAPILVSFLPCAAMCGVGICCMRSGKGGSCAGKNSEKTNKL